MSPQDLALELILRLLSLPDSVRTLLTKPVFSQQVSWEAESLMPSSCVYRGTLWNRKGILSRRVAPRGSWTPRNPSALSALSTRPPYSELDPLFLLTSGPGRTLLPSPPSVCLSLWHSGLDPMPSPTPSCSHHFHLKYNTACNSFAPPSRTTSTLFIDH